MRNIKGVMAQFLFFILPMDLKQINKQYFLKKDMYSSVLNGVSSSLLSYQNGIMYLEVVLTKKWTKSHQFTAFKLAHDWKKSFKMLEHAIGCKVFIIDLRDSEEWTTVRSRSVKTKVYRAKKGILFFPDQLN